MHFNKYLKVIILIVPLLAISMVCFYIAYDRHQDEENAKVAYEGVHQGIKFEFEVGCIFADLYEELLNCETDEISQKFVQEKLPDWVTLLHSERTKYTHSDSLSYYLSGDLGVWLLLWGQKCDTMMKVDFQEQRRDFLKRYAEQYKWGVACRYYNDHVDVDNYFSNQEILQERIDCYLIYNFCNGDNEKWGVWREKIANEYDDELLVLAENKNAVYEKALKEWKLEKSRQNPEDYEIFFQSEQTQTLLRLCEESIQADIDSLVYWRANNWVNNVLASPDYKVYFLQNYAHDFGEYKFLNV